MQAILRSLAVFALLGGGIPGPAPAQEQVPAPRPLAGAMALLRGGDWDGARAAAADDVALAGDVIEWHRLRAGRGTGAEALAFLAARPDWPGLPLLRRRAEAAISQMPQPDLRAYFDDNPPQTPAAVLIYAAALRRDGRKDAADALLVRAWRTMPMGAQTQAAFLNRHATLLKPHHTARLDGMLWDEKRAEAERMLPLVPEGWQALARARIALHEMGAGVDTLIAAVPPSLTDDPGLAHARFTWRMRKGRSADAAELLRKHSVSAEALGRPAKWAARRIALLRDLMQDGEARAAYEVASAHHMTSGPAFADLEWLAGYIALRRLDDPTRALAHFTGFADAVTSPISQARAGYWLGRTHEAAGRPEAAQRSYAHGAMFQSAFYGLLAAGRIGAPFDPALAAPQVPAWRGAAFTRSSVFRAGLLLHSAKEESLAMRFLTHLTESLGPQEAAQLAAVAYELNDPHMQVMIAKRAARRGIILPAAYYPLHPLGALDLPMAAEMSLAIARRESEFNPSVISGAGARGLMQVMPATGRLVAGELGLGAQHSAGRMLSDWRYNARLGAAYLSGLAATFDGNPVMIAAGYNAGPGRPRDWMQRFGDPRGRGEDAVVDWIERIPFAETRNYVMRVSESLPAYRARLGKPPLPVPFAAELAGSGLSAFAQQRE